MIYRVSSFITLIFTSHSYLPSPMPISFTYLQYFIFNPFFLKSILKYLPILFQNLFFIAFINKMRTFHVTRFFFIPISINLLFRVCWKPFLRDKVHNKSKLLFPEATRGSSLVEESEL